MAREQRRALLDLLRRDPGASWAAALAQTSARPRLAAAITFMSSRDRVPYSGISAKVHTDPPVGVPSATFMTRLRTPPMPDSTVTYCRPLWV